MDRWFRRSIVFGAAGALAACANRSDPPPLTSDWLLGRWVGTGEGQQLVVTSVHPEYSLALGAWSGEPVSIAVNGGEINFNTANGYSVQLSQKPGMLIGTLDRAPWLRPGPPLALLFLRPVAA